MNEKKNEDSLLNNLKAAGASLGGVVSDFAGRLREDRADKTAGADEETLVQRLRDAAGEARGRLSGAQGGDDIKNATSDFASEADSIVRELFSSVRTAAGGTRDSEAYTQISGLVSDAIGSVRGSVDEAVTKVRGQKDGEKATADEADADASSRLDSLMNRLRGDADPEVRDSGAPDIIDGEVVDDGTSGDANTDGK